jgi:hypothetical protein
VDKTRSQFSVENRFYRWAKQRDSELALQLEQDDPVVLCRSLIRIFGGFPRQGEKATPGDALEFLKQYGEHADKSIIRKLVGSGYLRPTSKGAGIGSYHDQVYILTRKGLNLVLNEGSDILAEELIRNMET